MNLYINKSFHDNISKVFDTLFVRSHLPNNLTIKIYEDALNSENSLIVPLQHVIFTSNSMLNILDKISNATWNESINLVTDGERIQLLTNTILNGNEHQRSSALNKLVQMGIILNSDTLMVKALTSNFLNYNKDNLNKQFITLEDSTTFTEYKYNVPLGLEKTYDKIRNTQNEKLYLLFTNYSHQRFGAEPITGENHSYFVKYWDDLFMKSSLTLSYGAIDIGDIKVPEDSETSIKYDHLDKIEYFDNFIIQIKIPNYFN